MPAFSPGSRFKAQLPRPSWSECLYKSILQSPPWWAFCRLNSKFETAVIKDVNLILSFSSEIGYKYCIYI